MSRIRLVAWSDDPSDRAAIDGGVCSIPTLVVPETGRVFVGLAELAQHHEAARAAS